MGRKPSPVWEFFGRRMRAARCVSCPFCRKSVINNAVQVADHFATCKQATPRAKRVAAACRKNRAKKKEVQADDDSCGTIQSLMSHPQRNGENLASRSVFEREGVRMSRERHARVLSEEQQQQLEKAVAHCLFTTGMPMHLVESHPFQYLLKQLNDAFAIPSYRKISSRYVDEVYEEVTADVYEKLEKDGQVVLAVDSWTNSCGEAALSISGITVARSFLLATYFPSGDRPTSEWIKDHIENFISEYSDKCKARIIGIVSDEEANVIGARQSIARDHNIYEYGSGCHAIHLCIADICDAFSPLKDICAQAKALVSDVTGTPSTALARLKELQQERQSPEGEWAGQLVSPCPTRSGSVVCCFKRLEENRTILEQLVSDISVVQTLRKETCECIRNVRFWESVGFAVKILDPLDAAAKQLEIDGSTLADQVHLWLLAKRAVLSAVRDFKFCEDDISQHEIITLVENVLSGRERLLLFGESVIAYLLHPGYAQDETGLGENAATFVDGSSLQPILHEAILFRNLLHGDKDGVHCAAMARTVEEPARDASLLLHPSTWWKMLAPPPFQHLKDQAVTLLALPPSSAAIGQTLSKFAHVEHSARIRVNPDRAAKLAFMYCNGSAFVPAPSQRVAGTAPHVSRPTRLHIHDRMNEYQCTASENENFMEICADSSIEDDEGFKGDEWRKVR